MTTKTQRCLDCDQPVQGRSDKKFCDPQCRSHYYNHHHITTASIVVINKILKKNRGILKQLNPTGKTMVRQTEVLKMGFNQKYHTHIYTTKNGSNYHFCYDQGFLDLGTGQLLLVVQEIETKREQDLKRKKPSS